MCSYSRVNGYQKLNNKSKVSRLFIVVVLFIVHKCSSTDVSWLSSLPLNTSATLFTFFNSSSSEDLQNMKFLVSSRSSRFMHHEKELMYSPFIFSLLLVKGAKKGLDRF